MYVFYGIVITCVLSCDSIKKFDDDEEFIVAFSFVVQPPVGLQSPFYHSRIPHHHHHRHHLHANHHDAQQQQQPLMHGPHSSPMHEAFPPPAARLFASSAAHSSVFPPAPPPPPPQSLLVGLSAVRHPASFEYQLKALYRRSVFDRPLSRQQDAVGESSSHAMRSPVSHPDTLHSESTGYDQMMMQAAAPQQSQQPESAACGYDGLAVISFHCRKT